MGRFTARARFRLRRLIALLVCARRCMSLVSTRLAITRRLLGVIMRRVLLRRRRLVRRLDGSRCRVLGEMSNLVWCLCAYMSNFFGGRMRRSGIAFDTHEGFMKRSTSIENIRAPRIERREQAATHEVTPSIAKSRDPRIEWRPRIDAPWERLTALRRPLSPVLLDRQPSVLSMIGQLDFSTDEPFKVLAVSTLPRIECYSLSEVQSSDRRGQATSSINTIRRRYQCGYPLAQSRE